MFDITGKIKLFAFDLDGTLYLGENLVPGAVELIDYLRKGYRIAFFTNNSSKTAGEVHEKLNRLGIKCEVNEVYASSSVSALYLKEAGLNDLYVIGSKSFRSELESKGLRIVESDLAKNLVVGLDFDFNYKKIADALSILLKGGKFIACNEDPYFPAGEGKYAPGCGAMVGAIAASANRGPDFIIGKPHTYILSIIAKAYKARQDEIVIVGDSYESDVMMALNYGSKAILVKPKSNLKNEDVLEIGSLDKTLTYIKEH